MVHSTAQLLASDESVLKDLLIPPAPPPRTLSTSHTVAGRPST